MKQFLPHIFSIKMNIVLKAPTWEMNQLIDHCIHAQEFIFLPHNCCVKIARTLTVYFWCDLFTFIPKIVITEKTAFKVLIFFS